MIPVISFGTLAAWFAGAFGVGFVLGAVATAYLLKGRK